ncbi:uncharacterized protein PV09_02851 [Verruconis gallopava]|uniref:Uncharacterized protein n=1 Tax=Verruconis gallopava TaxID=253628 RepID=A0A0D2AHL3_9PEZI|nr:uncharacterized protein PV09_02851 [Verruconis gallopava]KIW06398.1 hypothetical protein PV09_02851 [Verruconis gallopava]
MMPPIKIYADAPLHPEGVTPKTAEPEEASGPPPTKTTNQPPTNLSDPPAPQTGARPQVPAPTRVAGGSFGPSPPQPGAVPQPTITATYTTTTTSQLSPPSQMNIPAPSTNQAPTHSSYVPPASQYETGTTLEPPSSNLHGRRASLEHPPGYQQNPYAADGTPNDRERFAEAARQAQEEEGIMGSVMNALSSAGRRLSELEDEAWKWATGKK